MFEIGNIGVFLSVSVSVHPSIHPSVYPSIYLPTCLNAAYFFIFCCVPECFNVENGFMGRAGID